MDDLHVLVHCLFKIGGAAWLGGSVRDLQARDRGFAPRLG